MRIPEIDERICVVIPTYNNAVTVCDVLRRAYEQLPRIIVVNDGSTDETLDLLGECGTPHTLVTYEKNRGKGHALVAGFRKALEMGYDYAITLDSDGQHYPEDIPTLIAAHYDNPGALLVGSRCLKDKDMSGGSVFANKFSNFWFCVQTAVNLPDTQTGYRLYPLKRLRFLNLITSRYESELELMVFASWNGVKLLPVPINVFYPSRAERVSHFRPAYDFARISLLNTLLCFGAVVYGYPRKLARGLCSLAVTLLALVVFILGAPLLSAVAVVYKTLHGEDENYRMCFHQLLCNVARWVVRSIPRVKYTLRNENGEDFTKPAVIICNHQSHLDLMCAIALTPKLIIITKKWVWQNPMYGLIIRYAEFYPITFGYEQTLQHCADLVKRGYSILVYPEGTRSKDCRIGHFHRGAFFLAEQLGLDILPVFEYGLGKVLPKKGLHINPGQMYVEIKKRIPVNDTSFGTTFRERARRFERYYKEEYVRLAHSVER